MIELFAALLDYLRVRLTIIGWRRIGYAGLGAIAALQIASWSRPLGGQLLWFVALLCCADRAYFDRRT